MNLKPVVNWNKPESIPEVQVNSEKTFWLAVDVTIFPQSSKAETKTVVFNAKYVNRPLEIDSEGDPTNDDYLVSEDGEPMDAVGWFSEKEHADFNGYYDPLDFSDRYVLLGWAEYETPEFNIDIDCE